MGTAAADRSPTVARAVTTVAAVFALTSGAAASSYDVRPGDTLSGIAAREGTSVAELARINGLTDPDHVHAGTRLTLPQTDTVSGLAAERDSIGELIADVAGEHGWSPAFVKAIAWQESGWNNHRVSHAGAVGIMQVMPETGRFVSRLHGRTLDLDDPRDNVTAGVVFLQHLWELTDGDVERTLAGYYQGLGSVRANGMYPSTERYIDNVLALRERFR